MVCGGFWGEAGGVGGSCTAELMRLEAELKRDEPKPNILPGAAGEGAPGLGLDPKLRPKKPDSCLGGAACGGGAVLAGEGPGLPFAAC